MVQMKDRFQSMKRDLIFTALIILVIGILMVVFPDISALLICYVVGGAACIWGISRIISYFTTQSAEVFGSFGLVQGAALLLIGGFILIKPSVLAGALTVIFGIVLIVDGILKLQYAVDLSRMQAQSWWLVLLGAIAMVALGVVVLLNPFATAVTLMVFLGAALIADGVIDIISVGYISASIKQLKKAVKETLQNKKREADAIDTDFE